MKKTKSADLSIPTFSIIVPTFNRATRLQKLINSLLNIEYPKSLYEIIVIDDGSEDNTLEILKSYGDQIYYYSIENSERGFARNYGASKSKFEYLNFFDSDDICLPNHLICAASVIITNKFPEFIAQGFEMKTDDGKTTFKTNWRENEILNKKLYQNILGCDGVFMRKDIAKENKFSTDRRIAGSEDWLLWLQIAHKYPIIASQAITHYGIEHPGRSIHDSKLRKISEKTKILIRKISKFNYTYNGINIKKLSQNYLRLELSQHLTSDNSAINKIRGIVLSTKSFWSYPKFNLLKLYILSFTNFFGITASRKKN